MTETRKKLHSLVNKLSAKIKKVFFGKADHTAQKLETEMKMPELKTKYKYVLQIKYVDHRKLGWIYQVWYNGMMLYQAYSKEECVSYCRRNNLD